jgi:hypothetical protein
MAEVTEQDRENVRKLLDSAFLGHWHAAAHGLIELIAAAREQGQRSLIDSSTPPDISPLVWCNGRKASPKGHVLTDDGTVRRVLGTLPVTGDGCVATESENVFCADRPHGGRVRWSDEEGWIVEFDDTGAGEWKYSTVALCYSTLSAAEAARPTT